MINFNENSVLDLKPIELDRIHKELNGFLIAGEQSIAAFKTVRDQLVFTNKRIISIDVQGLTGIRKSFATLPYSKIQYMTVQTPGFIEFVSDAELELIFSNGFTAKFEFNGRVDIGAISRAIAEYVLQ